MGRQPANTKMGEKDVRPVRCRGGNMKYRAQRLAEGNFAWAGEAITKKCRIVDVVYNASNNEMVRTKSLVKGAVITIDAAPFRQWYLQHYGQELNKKKKAETEKKSAHLTRAIASRQKNKIQNPAFFEQFQSSRVHAVISSRPGQCGRCDGYLLEGKELEFYLRKLKEASRKK